MRMQLWHSTLSGALYGLIVGIAAQIGREIQTERAKERLADQFYPWSAPQLVDMLRPHAIPVLCSVTFAALGSLVFIIWLRRQ